MFNLKSIWIRRTVVMQNHPFACLSEFRMELIRGRKEVRTYTLDINKGQIK